MAKKRKKIKKLKPKRKVGRPRVNYEFEEAVEIVRAEDLRSVGQYAKWWKLHTPSKLPKRPDRAYKNEWKGWGYFLGYYNEYPFTRKPYRDYEDAMEFARSLNLSSINDWKAFVRSGNKPDDIPARPDIVYQTRRKWHTWTEFLGTKIESSIGRHEEASPLFYLAKYPNTPRDVYYFGITTSRNNLLKDYQFRVYKLYDYYDDVDWREIIEKYSIPYHDMGRGNEYTVLNMGGLLSELSMELTEIHL